MKLLSAICNVVFLVFGMPVALFGAVSGGEGVLRCIVIDAGHGGKDPGAVGNGQQEKAINLGVALKLGSMIEQQLPGVKVVYTRKDDRFIALADRSKIASQAGADLFISIHTNASTSSSASGTETYVMGEDKGNRNLSVVMRENAVISLEADYTSRYEGYDPNSSESLILFSLMQYAYQSQSLSLAELIQNQYAGYARRGNKGVKQAGFLVLWRTPMPSVLTEVGFISNPTEAKFLGSADGQEKIAASIFRAVKEYKQRTDSRTLAKGPSSGGSTSSGAAVAGGSVASTGKATSGRSESGHSSSSSVASERTTTQKTTTGAKSTGNESKKTTTEPRWVTEGGSGGRSTGKEESKAAAGTQTVFRIQVKSSLSRIPITRSNFGDYVNEVIEKRIDGRYKYYCGTSFSYQDALLLQRKVRRAFPDAFMVAFRRGLPVPLAEVIGK